MSDGGKYLYCIIRCAQRRSFEGTAPMGQADGGVYTVGSNGLAAVVSDSAGTRPESSRANMLAHERVLEKVLEEFTLLPVQFGTVAEGASAQQDIGRLLEKRSEEFQRLLGEMDGSVELGVKVLWRDLQVVFGEILDETPAIRRLRDSLQGKPPEVVRFEGIRLGEMVKGAMDQKRHAEAQRLLAPLRRIPCRTVENATLSDKMVANAAFLVGKEAEEEFDRAVRALDGELGHRMVFKYVGPTPPYNFVNIVVNWQDL